MVAGAGSGKTTSLVKALAHVVDSRSAALRANAQKIACITYTEIAAGEIADELAHDQLVHVSTIHSFLWTLIQPFQNDIRRWAAARVRARHADARDEEAAFTDRVGQARREKVEEQIRRFADDVSRVEHVERFTYGVGSRYSRGILGHEDITTMVPDLILGKPLLSELVAHQYPVVFVDESQDTLEHVVACLRHVAQRHPDEFCLGFFGDPMQKIYVRGDGVIRLDDGWQSVTKPENYRSPQPVLDVVNAIRAQDDGLRQVPGLPHDRQRPGEVDFFVLPADESRMTNLDLVRRWLAANTHTGAWTRHEGGDQPRTLVIAHRMAARHMGFERLYETFHSVRSLRTDFNEGHAWPLTPFHATLVPLVQAATHDRARLVPLLRASSPLLHDNRLDGTSTRERLRTLRTGVEQLATIITEGGPGSVGQALHTAHHARLLTLDPRIVPLLDDGGAHLDSVPMRDDVVAAIRAFLTSSPC